VESVSKPEWSAQQITEALQKNRGNVSRAARQLGLSRQAFYRRMEKFGIDPAGYDD
jgi:transcriptional regulator of acetoin/glycerol metabolism